MVKNCKRLILNVISVTNLWKMLKGVRITCANVILDATFVSRQSSYQRQATASTPTGNIWTRSGQSGWLARDVSDTFQMSKAPKVIIAATTRLMFSHWSIFNKVIDKFKELVCGMISGGKVCARRIRRWICDYSGLRSTKQYKEVWAEVWYPNRHLGNGSWVEPSTF